MIAFDELERALTRWKNRRSGGGAPAVEAEPAAPILQASEDEGKTPPPVAPDHTGEIDLADAVVEEI